MSQTRSNFLYSFKDFCLVEASAHNIQKLVFSMHTFLVFFECNLFSFQNMSQDYVCKAKCKSAMKYIEKSRSGDKQFVRSLWNWLRWKAFFAAPTQRYLGQWWIICQLFQGMLLRWLSRDANFDPKIRSASTNWGYFGPNLARIKD